MEKMEHRIDTVLKILKKQAPLTVKQEKYCNDSCVERFLKGKGDNVKKAAKHMRAVLSWRDNIGTDHLIADEFSSELAEGVAYVSGHDDEGRPVVVFRVKQEYLKSNSQKTYLRLLVFTLEVAISTMSRFVDQLVLLFDASFFRSAPAFLSLYMVSLKVIADYYPGRLHKAFVVDPPSVFSCLWKGARPFVEQWTATTVVSSLSVDLEDSRPKFREERFSFYPQRTASLRFEPSPKVVARSDGGGGSTSSRFAFTVSHLDSFKPWYLSSVGPAPTPPKPSHVVPTTASPSSLLAGAGGVRARSFSFASPTARSNPTRGSRVPACTPMKSPCQHQQQPRTPIPSFLQSPFSFAKKKKKKEKDKDNEREQSFKLYLRFYAWAYDEMVYRSKMRPPLGGLLSIVSPQLIKQRRQWV